MIPDSPAICAAHGNKIGECHSCAQSDLISALRSENEALRKRNEELDSDLAHFQTLARERGDALWRTGAHRFYSEDMPTVAVAAIEHLETELQEMETKLRAAEDAVVALTKNSAEAIGRIRSSRLHSSLELAAAEVDAAEEILKTPFDIAALAAQRKREIVRNAYPLWQDNHFEGPPPEGDNWLGFMTTCHERGVYSGLRISAITSTEPA